MTTFFRIVDLIKAYDWLVCWMLKITAERLEQNRVKHKDKFTAFNESQAYYARTLAIVFAEVILHYQC